VKCGIVCSAAQCDPDCGAVQYCAVQCSAVRNLYHVVLKSQINANPYSVTEISFLNNVTRFLSVKGASRTIGTRSTVVSATAILKRNLTSKQSERTSDDEGKSRQSARHTATLATRIVYSVQSALLRIDAALHRVR
jgi:hypothetical protein